MSYLDDLSQWSALAQVKIADLSIELAQARADSQNTGALIDEICWYTLLLTGANDTTQEDDLRLELLTLLVDGARLGPLSTAVGVYNLYQPISPTSVATVPFNLVTGDILSNASAAAQFALVLYKSGGTMTGPLLIDPTTRIDSTGALNIGTSTATTTTIGRVGQNVAMPGTITLATWGGVAIPIAKGGTGVSAVGTAGQVLATNGAANGTEWITPAGSPVGVYLPLAGGTMTGPLLMTAGIAIDAATAGALSFGATTATTITIGRATQTVNFPGTIGSGLWNGTVIGRPYGGFGNAMANVPGGNFVYGYDVGDDESQFWTVGSRLTYGTQELNVNPVLVLTSVAASSFLQAGTASSATGQIRLAHASTANLTTITAGNAASALTFVWPVVNPTIGQLLTASAPSGSTVTLSWSSALTNPLDNVGQLIYGGVAGAPTKLAADLTNTKKYLSTTSIGGVGQAPVWSTIGSSDLPVVPLSKGGTGQALADPNANRFMFWDDTTSAVVWAVLGTGLSYDVASKTVSVSAAGIVTSVTGTANRITASPTSGAVIVDISAAYVGQATITTVGTISTGTWEGAVVDYPFGGTGLSTLGTGLQVLRTNAGATAMEWATLGGGSGTVTSFSIVAANGFGGSVANSTTTPALTLTCTVTGVLKSNGTTVSAAVAGTDYLTPFGYTAKTANYTILTTDTVINCTANSFTLTFPTAVGISGKMFVVKNVGAGIITLAGNGGQTFDGVASPTIPTNTAFILFSDGANWIIA